MNNKKSNKGRNVGKQASNKASREDNTTYSTEIAPTTEIIIQEPANEMNGAVIDNYFINGFNKTQAMLTVKPELSYHVAASMAQVILDNPRNKAYIEEKRSRLRASTDIRNENVLRELINWAYCDVTQFMGLTEDEIKDLPADIRRCIQGFKSTHRTTYNPATKETTTIKTMDIRVDKKAAMESIAKHIGFFSIDNEQKRTKINLTKVDATILNAFMEAIEVEQLE